MRRRELLRPRRSDVPTMIASAKTNQYLEKASAKKSKGRYSHSIVAGGLPEMS